MMKSKFTDEQIAVALKLAETEPRCLKFTERCAFQTPPNTTRKKEYGGLNPDEIRRLKQIEAESHQL